MPETTESARVVAVAAGVEQTDRAVPVRDGRHQALEVLIGKWVNEGRTIGTAEVPSVAILTSDVYEWAPGGFFVLHSAFGRIGETAVGGVEMIGVHGDAYRSTFLRQLRQRPPLPPGDRRRRAQVDRRADPLDRDADRRRADPGRTPRSQPGRGELGPFDGRDPAQGGVNGAQAPVR
ncbi:hypothetical protein [Amycolatopsis saalfeldensis]|uniref:Uncharacterized protein n=1 Tax=Amycolatopsis saalfeldensis TaxID=394193 RepID=A0A1H8PRU4_9PSEU|nr:hypothetical protein [Amycolatopsis saalfeldensis]SEO44437.1 hypothetical protein SAMN04489732_10138 [Amycolatopsis saalfeldensis]